MRTIIGCANRSSDLFSKDSADTAHRPHVPASLIKFYLCWLGCSAFKFLINFAAGLRVPSIIFNLRGQAICFPARAWWHPGRALRDSPSSSLRLERELLLGPLVAVEAPAPGQGGSRVSVDAAKVDPTTRRSRCRPRARSCHRRAWPPNRTPSQPHRPFHLMFGWSQYVHHKPTTHSPQSRNIVRNVYIMSGRREGRNMKKLFATWEKVFATWKKCSQHDVWMLVATCSPQPRNMFATNS
jgi:hypothetical protein